MSTVARIDDQRGHPQRYRLDEVIVLASMAGFAHRRDGSPAEQADRHLRRLVTRALRAEIWLLAAERIRVQVFTSSSDDLVAMNLNVMNPARRREVLRTAQRTTMRHLADGSIQYPRDARPA